MACVPVAGRAGPATVVIVPVIVVDWLSAFIAPNATNRIDMLMCRNCMESCARFYSKRPSPRKCRRDLLTCLARPVSIPPVPIHMKETCRLCVSILLLLLFAGRGLAQSSAITGTIVTYAGPPLPISRTQATTQVISSPASVAPTGLEGFTRPVPASRRSTGSIETARSR